MIGRLNHVGIAVPRLADGAAFYRDGLGAKVAPPVALPEHGVTVAFVALPNARIELMEPLGSASPLVAFLERHPAGGLHHICYEVADLADACGRLVAGGARLLGPPRAGAHGRPMFFVHPKDALGTLIELEEV